MKKNIKKYCLSVILASIITVAPLQGICYNPLNWATTQTIKQKIVSSASFLCKIFKKGASTTKTCVNEGMSYMKRSLLLVPILTGLIQGNTELTKLTDALYQLTKKEEKKEEKKPVEYTTTVSAETTFGLRSVDKIIEPRHPKLEENPNYDDLTRTDWRARDKAGNLIGANEDRYINTTIKSEGKNYPLIAVFDGNGGSTVSEYLKENFALTLQKQDLTKPIEALKNATKKLSAEINNFSDKLPGSTAIVALIDTQNASMLNLGDSRAITISNDSVDQVFNEHNPKNPDELDKLKNLSLEQKAIDGITFTRAFGATGKTAKNKGGNDILYISSEPDTKTIPLKDGLIIALMSDGVPEIIENITGENDKASVNTYLAKQINQKKSAKTIIDELAQKHKNKNFDNSSDDKKKDFVQDDLTLTIITIKKK